MWWDTHLHLDLLGEEGPAAIQAAKDSEMRAQQAAELQTKIQRWGGLVAALSQQLYVVGWSIPCDSSEVIAGLVARVAAGTLTADQETARARVADLYAILKQFGATDADIADVWDSIKVK